MDTYPNLFGYELIRVQGALNLVEAASLLWAARDSEVDTTGPAKP